VTNGVQKYGNIAIFAKQDSSLPDMEFNFSKLQSRHPSDPTPGPSPQREGSVVTGNIKNIIFDFGGVICDIDVRLTKQAFIDIGWRTADQGRSISGSKGLFEDLEVGTITPQHFRDELRKFFDRPVSDAELDEAWNRLLLDMPEERIRLLEDLRKKYRIFLLSNSNGIHYNKYVQDLRERFGYPDFDALFEKAYFSFRLGLKKPDPAIFRYVLEDSRLEPAETLFIDDTLMHVEGARKTGILGYHLNLVEGEQMTGLFT